MHEYKNDHIHTSCYKSISKNRENAKKKWQRKYSNAENRIVVKSYKQKKNKK